MLYVYVLRSESDKKFYIGFTSDLQRRFTEHQSGKVRATKARRPLELVYYEAHRNRSDAMKREQFLKTGWGRNWLKRTIEHYLRESG